MNSDTEMARPALGARLLSVHIYGLPTDGTNPTRPSRHVSASTTASISDTREIAIAHLP